MTDNSHQQYFRVYPHNFYENSIIDEYYSVIDSLDIPRKGIN